MCGWRNTPALGESRRQLADRAAWLAEEVRRRRRRCMRAEQELLFRTSRAAEFRDPETGEHIQRMAQSSRLIAERLGLSVAEQELIRALRRCTTSASSGILTTFCSSPGHLSSAEFEIMKQHATIGYELLKDSDSTVLQAAATIAAAHHDVSTARAISCTGWPARRSRLRAHRRGGRCVRRAHSERPYKPAWAC